MSEPTKIEEHFLPEELRYDLCMGLLEEHGAEKIQPSMGRKEIIHCCLMPWHDESRPSASINFERLTYRCLGCQSKGGLYWLIATLRGLDSDQAKEWLSGVSGLGGKEFQLGPLLQFLDAVDADRQAGRQKPNVPKYSEKVLDPWGHIYPGLTTGAPDLGIIGRGIPEANLREARVGWDMSENRIIIPNFWRGDLVGWQARRILSDGSPKYKSTPDFPKDSTVYGVSSGRSAVIVESPMSRLRHMHHLPMTATWGATITDRQIQILKWIPDLVFWPDPDPAGWKMVEGWVDDEGREHPGAAEILEAYSSVRVVESEWAADPAEIDDDLAAEMVASAVPLSLWSRPTGCLRCIRCKEKHEGSCASSEV